MNRSEAGQLLLLLASFDRRTVSKADAVAWSAALWDVPWDDATRSAAAAFYGTSELGADAGSQRWAQPHHIRATRKRLVEDRLARVPEPAPNAVDGVPSGREIAAVRRAIADGLIGSAADAAAYEAWGGSLYVAYSRKSFPELSQVQPLTLAKRPMRELTAGRRVDSDGPGKPPTGDAGRPAGRPGLPVPTLSVACPYGPCGAAAGAPCTGPLGPLREPHPSRLAADHADG